MYPPVFKIIAIDSNITNVFGSNPVRVFPFNDAPEMIEKPYALWSTISGTPGNYLGTIPDYDSWFARIDIYSGTGSGTRDAALLLRNAFDNAKSTYITAWHGEIFETEINLFRYSFDVNFLTLR